MHADDRAAQAIAHFGDRKGRRIGCKHTVCRNNAVQFFKGFFFYLHIFFDSFNDQIGIFKDFFCADCDPV